MTEKKTRNGLSAIERLKRTEPVKKSSKGPASERKAITVYLNIALYRKFKEYCDQRGTSVSKVFDDVMYEAVG